MLEASPSPVYGAALLMRFGTQIPSRVQIPPPPHLIPKPRSSGPGLRRCSDPRASPLPPRSIPGLISVSAGRKGYANRISHDGGSHVMFFLSPRAGRKGRERKDKNKRTSTRSLTDRASDYGSEGCRFESCRVHRDQRPRRNPGPLAFSGRLGESLLSRRPGASCAAQSDAAPRVTGRPEAAHAWCGTARRIRIGQRPWSGPGPLAFGVSTPLPGRSCSASPGTRGPGRWRG